MLRHIRFSLRHPYSGCGCHCPDGAAAYADAADVLEHGSAVQHSGQHAAKLHRNSRIGTGGLQPEPEKSDTDLRPQSVERNYERHLVTQQFGPGYF